MYIISSLHRYDHDLIRRLAHELLGLLPPDGGHGDHPPDVLLQHSHITTCRHAPPRAAHVSDLGAGGVPQLLYGVVPEVPEGDGEDVEGTDTGTVGRGDLGCPAK